MRSRQGEYLYTTNFLDPCIRQIATSTSATTTIAGSGARGASDATGTSASFDYLGGLVIDSTSGYLYIAGYQNSKIRKYTISTGAVTTLVSSGFIKPRGIEISADGSTLYIAEYGNHKVRTVNTGSGAASTLANVRGSSDAPPFELVRTERGGEVTYHGPGQLVLYPMLDLRAYRQDVHWYMRALEEVAMRALADVGLPAAREPGLTGVWVDGAKACAIGVKLSRWVSMHGLALNVATDLAHFEHIVPCGIADRPVTSVARELQRRRLDGATDAAIGGAPDGDDALLAHMRALLLKHFAAVFDVDCRVVEHDDAAHDGLLAAGMVGAEVGPRT